MSGGGCRWLLLSVLLVGCGGSALPVPDAGTGGGLEEDSGVEAKRSLYPISPGSSWTYRITEAGKAPFEKKVRVVGREQVPELSSEATKVVSQQPHLEERSWQVSRDGMVMRVREEDWKPEGGLTLARVTTWEPLTIKSLAAEREVGFVYRDQVVETVRFLATGEVEQKQKTYTWRVVGRETVTVPAGTFEDAYKVVRERTDKDKQDRVYWLVPGVGKVKEDGERLEELVSYDVKDD